MPTKFEEKIYSILRKIPKGKVTTYKSLASAVRTRAYRAVGNALNKNPYAPEVPCHRVVNSDGRIGGFAWGTKRKIELLKKEGIKIKNGRVKNFREVFAVSRKAFICNISSLHQYAKKNTAYELNGNSNSYCGMH